MKSSFYDDDEDDDLPKGAKSKPKKEKSSMADDLEGEVGRESFRRFMKSVGLTAKDENASMRHLSRFMKNCSHSDDDDDDGSDWDEEDYGTNSARTSGGSPKVKSERKRLASYSADAYDDDDEDYLKDRKQQNGQYYT